MQSSKFEVQSEECEVQTDELTESSNGDAEEAICTSTGNEEPTEAPSPTVNTKAHLSSSVPRAAKLPQGMLTKGEMAEIRSIFGNIDDAEIQRLYKRVTK